MLLRRDGPLATPPRGTGRPPSPCFLRSPHSCHLRRSVGKSSPHKVTHMEHHICRIFILTRVRASSGCRQSLCLMLEWGFLPGGQQGRQRAGQAAHTRGAGLCSGTTPILEPRALVCPPSVLWVGGSAVPHHPGYSHVVTAVEQLSVLLSQLGTSQKAETTRSISTERI